MMLVGSILVSLVSIVLLRDLVLCSEWCGRGGVEDLPILSDMVNVNAGMLCKE